MRFATLIPFEDTKEGPLTPAASRAQKAESRSSRRAEGTQLCSKLLTTTEKVYPLKFEVLTRFARSATFRSATVESPKAKSLRELLLAACRALGVSASAASAGNARLFAEVPGQTRLQSLFDGDQSTSVEGCRPFAPLADYRESSEAQLFDNQRLLLEVRLPGEAFLEEEPVLPKVAEDGDCGEGCCDPPSKHSCVWKVTTADEPAEVKEQPRQRMSFPLGPRNKSQPTVDCYFQQSKGECDSKPPPTKKLRTDVANGFRVGNFTATIPAKTVEKTVGTAATNTNGNRCYQEVS